MLKMMKRMFHREEGQSLVEYALIIALVAIVLIAGLTALGVGIEQAFQQIIGSL
jgi:pilus assembly protein Flp/PilA